MSDLEWNLFKGNFCILFQISLNFISNVLVILLQIHTLEWEWIWRSELILRNCGYGWDGILEDAVPTMSTIPEDYSEGLVIVMPSQPYVQFPRITLRSWWLWCCPNHMHNSWGLLWSLGYCDAVPTMSTIPEDYSEVLVIVMPSLPCLRFLRITLRAWLLWCHPSHVYDSRGLPWGLVDCDAVPIMSMIPEDYPEVLVIVMLSLPCLWFQRIILRA